MATKQLLSLRDVDINADTNGKVTSFRDSVMVVNATTETEARAYALATVPVTQYGLLRGDITLRETPGSDMFKFNVDYKIPDFSDGLTPLPAKKISFDTGGTTKHITLAEKLTIQRDYPLDGTEPKDFQNLIGVNEDGTVSGVDIPAYGLKFSETHYFIKDQVSSNLLRNLKAMSGKINSKVFRSFKIGEVLFTGASGNWDADTRVITITYNFEVNEDEGMITYKDAYGDEYQVASKRGWDYRWIYYVKALNSHGQLVPKIAAIVDQQVFKEVDFGYLGIGI
ncbi:MAG: hypothetical protein WCI51_02315 [Lentisphaerota bacterium]